MTPRAPGICVYCGSSLGHRAAFLDAARVLGRLIASRGGTLVYGGGNVGLMGELARSALAAGGRVIGVIPESLVRRELAHPDLSELHVTDSMHARKAKMAELSDCFVALPGGIGTLDEIFEIWTWANLGLHDKPFGMLNVGGYFDPLLEFLDRAVAEGYLAAAARRMLRVSASAETLLAELVSAASPGSPVRGNP